MVNWREICRDYHVGGKRQFPVVRSIVLVLLVSVLNVFLNDRAVQAQEKGKILAIVTEKDVFKRGETIRVRVEVQNLQRGQRHQLVVLNILDSAEKAIYDSNLVKQNIDFVIGSGERRTVGPFTFKIPGNVPRGTYMLLVGYREYPWEPLIEFRGARWCPPVRTVTIE